MLAKGRGKGERISVVQRQLPESALGDARFPPGDLPPRMIEYGAQEIHGRFVYSTSRLSVCIARPESMDSAACALPSARSPALPAT